MINLFADVVGDNLTEVAKQGLLGVLLVISLVVNFYLGRMVLREKDKRIQEAEKVRDDIAQPMSYIKDSLDLIERKVRISKGE